MPMNTISDNHDAEYPVDAFFAKVIQSVRQREEDTKRRRLRNKQTFSLPEAPALTGLTVEEIRALTDDGSIDDMYRRPWLLSRDEVFTLVLQHAEENNCQAGLEYLALATEEETEVQEPRRYAGIPL